LVPFIQAFKEAGATEGDRKTLLAADVKKFCDAVIWGNRTEALSLVVDEARDPIGAQLRSAAEEEKIVDSKVDEIQWGDGALTAKAFVKVRFYKIPFYVVKTRVEEQHWEFASGSGWRMTAREVGETKNS
jgi:hypothetical protein